MWGGRSGLCPSSLFWTSLECTMPFPGIVQSRENREKTVICGLCSPGLSGPGYGQSRVLSVVGDEWEARIRRPQ